MGKMDSSGLRCSDTRERTPLSRGPSTGLATTSSVSMITCEARCVLACLCVERGQDGGG